MTFIHGNIEAPVTRGVSFTVKDIAESYYSEGFSLIGTLQKSKVTKSM